MFKVHVDSETNTDLRSVAKVLNFGIAYGMSAYKLANDFEISTEEAEDFIKKFYEAYPGLEKYFKDERRNALETGYILADDVIGRKSFLEGVHESYLETANTINHYREFSSLKEVPKQVWSNFYSAKGKIERLSQNVPRGGNDKLGELRKQALKIRSQALTCKRVKEGSESRVRAKAVMTPRAPSSVLFYLFLIHFICTYRNIFIYCNKIYNYEMLKM